LVSRAIAAIPANVFQRCPGLVSPGSKSTLLRPVTFAEDGTLSSGAWKQEFPVSGCGNDTTLNIYFSVDPARQVRFLVGLPGATHADIVLQSDAIKYAQMGASVKAKDCQRFDVKNTQFNVYGLPDMQRPDPGPNDKFRPWSETWTLIGCGRTFDVPLNFSPDATGTQITQQSGKVVER
jgi:hypothetical protein